MDEVTGNPAPEAEVRATPETETDSVVETILEEEGVTADQEAPKDEEPKPLKLKVKIDGQELEVDAEEAARGYQRQADYSRNMQKLQAQMQEAQAVQARYQQQLDQFIPESYARLTALQQAAEQYRQEGNWEALSAVQYDMQTETQKIQMANAEKQRLADEYQQRTQQQRSMALKQAETAVLDAIPEWKNPESRKAEIGEVTKVITDFVSKNYGDAAQQILADINDGLYGPMPIVLAREAMLYRKLMGKVAARKAGKSEQTQAPAPVTTVRTSGGASKDPSKMSTEEWMAWRNKQVGKR